MKNAVHAQWVGAKAEDQWEKKILPQSTTPLLRC